MPIESASFISQLNAANPTAADPKSEGDDQLRLIKSVLKGQFPNFTAAAVNVSVTEMNRLVGVTADIQGQLNTLDSAKSLRAGDTYTGAHNFTGATLSVATPTQPTNPVTKLYADSLVFAAVLPAQSASVAGLSVTTDGSAASWSLSTPDALAYQRMGVI